MEYMIIISLFDWLLELHDSWSNLHFQLLYSLKPGQSKFLVSFGLLFNDGTPNTWPKLFVTQI